MIDHFDTAKLSSNGFKVRLLRQHSSLPLANFDLLLFQVLVSQSDVSLPDGTVVPNGLAFRNEFHLTPYSTADLFVPCGGRPEAVNLKNVHRFVS